MYLCLIAGCLFISLNNKMKIVGSKQRSFRGVDTPPHVDEIGVWVLKEYNKTKENKCP